MFDLTAYLDRIGLDSAPSLAELHRAHMLSIPFENLDSLAGLPVELDIESLQAKLVGARRGGYCFEQNLLFKAALEALGMEVEPMLARVRWGRPPDTVSALSHLVLRVTVGGEAWMADVGFGAGTLIEPIPFGAGAEHEQLGWRFRIVEEADELVLQMQTSEGWRDVYAFLPRPVPQIDIEVANWWVSTHPTSPFVTGLIGTTTRADGARVSLSDWRGDLELVVRTPSDSEAVPVSREQLPELLAEHFGLSDFSSHPTVGRQTS